MSEYEKVILITGGAGFIGRWVVELFALKYPQYRIIVYDALTYAGNLENLKNLEKPCSNFEFVKGDINDFKAVDELFATYGITDVIHMAAESHVDRSITNPFDFVNTNVMGTLNLLQVARNYWRDYTDRHVFFSMITDEIFGSLGKDDPPFNENTPLDPHSPYSTSKTAQYLFGKTYYETYGVPVISLACGNAIGGYQFPEKLVPLTIDRLLNGQNIPIYGKGEQMRDWTNVLDIADAIDVIFHRGNIGELYCIGGDACRSNIDMVHAIISEVAEQTGKDEEELKKLITFIPDPRGKAHDFRYDLDHSKITNELGWKPFYAFEDSVRIAVTWYLENQEWVNNVKTGEYKNWIESYYGKEINKK